MSADPQVLGVSFPDFAGYIDRLMSYYDSRYLYGDLRTGTALAPSRKCTCHCVAKIGHVRAFVTVARETEPKHWSSLTSLDVCSLLYREWPDTSRRLKRYSHQT